MSYYEDRPLRRTLSLAVLPTYNSYSYSSITPSSRYTTYDLPYTTTTVARLRRAASVPDISSLSTRLALTIPPIRTYKDWATWDDYWYNGSYRAYKPFYSSYWPYSYLSKYRYYDYPSRWWNLPSGTSYYTARYRDLTYPYSYYPYLTSSLYSPYTAPYWRRYYDPYYDIDRSSWLTYRRSSRYQPAWSLENAEISSAYDLYTKGLITKDSLDKYWLTPSYGARRFKALYDFGAGGTCGYRTYWY